MTTQHFSHALKGFFLVFVATFATPYLQAQISIISTGTGPFKTFSVTGLPINCTCTNQTIAAQYSFYWEFGDGNYKTITGSATTSILHEYVAGGNYVARVEVTPIKVGNGGDDAIKYAATGVAILVAGITSNPTIANPSYLFLEKNRDIVPDKFVTLMINFENTGGSLPFNETSIPSFSPSSSCPSFSSFNRISVTTFSSTGGNISNNYFTALTQAYYYSPTGTRTSLVGDTYPPYNAGAIASNETVFDNNTSYSLTTQTANTINLPNTYLSTIAHGNFFIKLKTAANPPLGNIQVKIELYDSSNPNCKKTATVPIRSLRSYDPNIKTVNPQYINASTGTVSMQYKIECENEGGAAVKSITITDNIPIELDAQSIILSKVVLGSFSASGLQLPANGVQTQITLNGPSSGTLPIKLTCNYSNDNLTITILPDNNNNENLALLSPRLPNTEVCEESTKGSIEYSVNALQQPSCGEHIFGTSAQIVFDNNFPIETNRAFTTHSCDLLCPSSAEIVAPNADVLFYEVQNNITGNTPVAAGAKVYANAGQSILLTPGCSFQPNANGVADLYIDGCNQGFGSGKQSWNEAANQLLPTVALNTSPNPFTSYMLIEFYLPQESPVFLAVYDMSGKQVATLLNNQKYEAGEHQIDFFPPDLPSGMYMCQLKTSQESVNHKMACFR
jgi:hypothetical protein